MTDVDDGEAHDDAATLAALVGDVDRFGCDHWGRRPLHRPTGTSFEHLLSIERIEELLSTSARRPTFRLVRDGATLPDGRSTRPVRLGGRLIEDVADAESIAAAMADGATLVMQALQRTDLAIARFCRSLERATSHPVQANAYLTPSGAAGLAAHEDEHDVFVLQIDGHKEWTAAGLGRLRLEPGDLLYLPSGTRHEASAQDRPSLHLTIGVLTVTHAAVLRRLLARVDDEALSRPLPLRYARSGGTSLVDELRTALDRAVDVITALDVESLAAAEVARANRRRRPLASGHLRTVLELDGIGLSSRVRRRADAPAVLDPQGRGDRVGMQLVDRRMSFPAAMRPALELLLGGGIVAVGQLPGLDEGSRVVLARRLLRELVLEHVVTR